MGAAATLLIEQCRAKNLAFTPEEASLALIAIHEETGSFRYASTTHRDLQAAAFLMEQGANLEVVSDFLKDPLSDAQRALLEGGERPCRQSVHRSGAASESCVRAGLIGQPGS